MSSGVAYVGRLVLQGISIEEYWGYESFDHTANDATVRPKSQVLQPGILIKQGMFEQ